MIFSANAIHTLTLPTADVAPNKPGLPASIGKTSMSGAQSASDLCHKGMRIPRRTLRMRRMQPELSSARQSTVPLVPSASSSPVRPGIPCKRV